MSVAVLGLLSLGVITSRVGSYIVTPLWLDYFSGAPFPLLNVTPPHVVPHVVPLYPAHVTSHSVGAQFIVVGQWGCSAIATGLCLLWIILCCPSRISDTDRKYPKRKLFVIGCSQAVSSMLMTYASSGSRVAPYLQGLLSNFNIPIQFTTRYVAGPLVVGQCQRTSLAPSGGVSRIARVPRGRASCSLCRLPKGD